jgi:outer membrane protein TolC
VRNSPNSGIFAAVLLRLLLAAAALPAAAQTSGLDKAAETPEAGIALTLNSAIERALENSLNLKKNRIDLSSAEYSARRLWAEIFPAITASAGAGYSSALFSGDGFTLNKQGQSFSAGLGISLALNAGIPYTIKNIRLAHQTRLLNYEDARNQLTIQITKNFYSLIAGNNNLDYLADMLRLAEQQHEKNRIAFNNGLVGELALRQSQLGLENARYNASAARSAYTTRMGEFLALLGFRQGEEARLEGEISIEKIEADAGALVREHLPKRPDIVSRRQEIERLENAEKQTALSARAPSLRLSAEWSSRNFDPFTDTASGSAALSIPIDPWIPGTKTAQSIRSAQSAVEKAKLDLHIAEDAAITQIHSLAANLRNSWDSIEIARLSVEVAQRGYQLTEQGFRAGTVESLALEDARNNLGSARQRLLQSELAYLDMTLDLSAALNIDWKELVQ